MENESAPKVGVSKFDWRNWHSWSFACPCGVSGDGYQTEEQAERAYQDHKFSCLFQSGEMLDV